MTAELQLCDNINDILSCCRQILLCASSWSLLHKNGAPGLGLPRCRALSQSTECAYLTHKAERLVTLSPPLKCLELARSSISWTMNKIQTENNLLKMFIFFSTKALAWLIKNKITQCQPFLVMMPIFLSERFVLYSAAPQPECSLQLHCYACNL